MAQLLNGNQIKLNSGKIVQGQEGGWYDAMQLFGGSLSAPGVINANSNQQGAGQKVSNEVIAQTNPSNVEYINQLSSGASLNLPTTSAVTQSAAVDVAVSVAAAVINGRHDTGYRNVTSVVVKDTIVTPNTYVEGTDYTLSKKGGYIVILEGGSITAGLALALTVNAPSGTGTLINAMQLDALQGRLTYTGEASVGDSHEYVLEKVSLNASGDVALKSGEFTTISFEGSVLKHLGKYFTTETF